jgi:hypothetical protein
LIALVHLIWGPAGELPLRRFVTSYRSHPPGVDHELVLLLNGVDEPTRGMVDEVVGELPHRRLELDSPAQDLSAYALATERLSHDRLCFLNSYSEALADGWLAKLNDALEQPRVGMAGATGSWASFHSTVLNSLGLPNPYRKVPQPRGAEARQLWVDLEIEMERARLDDDSREQTPPAPSGPWRRNSNRLRSLRQLPAHLVYFEGFPAHHLRTNAFVVRRDVFASLRHPAIRTKMDALRLESGRSSYTRQVQRLGLRAVVVDRHGDAHDQDAWPDTHTLWQGDQENLLIADNRTVVYANGDLRRRALLAARAWGPRAEASLPGSSLGVGAPR